MSTTEHIQNVPDHPGRFNIALAVLGMVGFSSGRHYWEVSVAGKLCYHLGMASESAQRRGTIIFSPTKGFWTVVLDKEGQLKEDMLLFHLRRNLLDWGFCWTIKRARSRFTTLAPDLTCTPLCSKALRTKSIHLSIFVLRMLKVRHLLVISSPGSDWIK